MKQLIKWLILFVLSILISMVLVYNSGIESKVLDKKTINHSRITTGKIGPQEIKVFDYGNKYSIYIDY